MWCIADNIYTFVIIHAGFGSKIGFNNNEELQQIINAYICSINVNCIANVDVGVTLSHKTKSIHFGYKTPASNVGTTVFKNDRHDILGWGINLQNIINFSEYPVMGGIFGTGTQF